MVQKEIKFSDGTRIFYERENGILHRYIEYAYTQKDKELIKNKPQVKSKIESKVRKCNAGKYYYLDVLYSIVCKINDSQRHQLYNDLKELHDKVGQEYDSNILNKDFLCTFGKYWHDNIQCAAFFSIIYLAMLDLEENKKDYPNSLGKTVVLKSCKAVILDNVDPRDAAIMFEKKKPVPYHSVNTEPHPREQVIVVFDTIESNCEKIANAIMEYVATTNANTGILSINVGIDAVEDALFNNNEYIEGINKYLKNYKAIKVRIDSKDLNCLLVKYEKFFEE